MKKDEGKRILIVTDTDGRFKVEIPPDAKVTFGPALPFMAKSNNAEQYYGQVSQRGYALRVYRKTKDNIIAVFTGVKDFRDVTIPVSREILREGGNVLWKSDEDGYTVEATVKREREFKALDAAFKVEG